MPVTLQQIADKAGVSRGVVSAVLNKKSKNSRVGAETRKRIEKIAAELQYLPNQAAQALRTHKTGTVNVLIPGFKFFEEEGYANMVTSMQQHLEENGYTLQITSLSNSFRNRKPVRHIHGDGIILFYWGPAHDLVEELAIFEVPVLVVLGKYDGGKASNLYIDQRTALYNLARAVIGKGHRNIVHMYSYPDVITDEMIAGARRAADEAGDVRMREIWLKPAGSLPAGVSHRVDQGRRGLDEVLALPERPTAVMFSNDNMAMAAIQRANELGVRVPQDISITGAGDRSLAQVFTPRLTTTQNRYHEAGTMAAGMILEEIEDADKPVRQVGIAPGPVLRDSLGNC